MRFRLPIIAAVILAAICAPQVFAAKDGLVLASRQTDADGGFGGNDISYVPSLSADGQFVAFSSSSTNLNAATRPYLNVFVRDLGTGTTTLASRQSPGAGGAGANDTSDYPDLAADAKSVAFESAADNLATDDNNSVRNIFVRNLATGAMTTVTKQSSSDGGVGADGDSELASISADGRYVAFDSGADNLSTEDNNAVQNVFVRDLQTNVTTLASRATGTGGGSAGGDGSSDYPSISADGRYVAFESAAANLSTEDNNVENIFVRDLQTNTTILVSRQTATAGGAGAGSSSYYPAISADGHRVAYTSDADNLSTEDNDAVTNLFVRDLQANTTTLVSRQSEAAGGAGGDGNSAYYIPALSADGRYIAFNSDADNLSPDDRNDFTNTFVRDTQDRTTTLVSRQTPADGGAGADGDSRYYPSISADGRYVSFESKADNLSSVDTPGVDDIFVRDVLGAPPEPDPGDTTPPGVRTGAKGKQKLGKPIKIVVTSDEAGTATAMGTASVKGGGGNRRALAKAKLKFKPATAQLSAGVGTTLTLKPPKRTARRLKHAKAANAGISLTVTDAAGNETTKALKVKLR